MLSESRSELRSLLLPHRSRSSRTPDSALARFRIGMSRERRLSARTPVSLRQKPVLTSFGSGQQVGELWSPAQLREQGVSLQGSVRAIVVFNSTVQQAQGSIVAITVR